MNLQNLCVSPGEAEGKYLHLSLSFLQCVKSEHNKIQLQNELNLKTGKNKNQTEQAKRGVSYITYPNV